MGLFDGLLGGGGGGSADDPYADILTPAQRNQMQVQGLLAMAGAFAAAGMPSRLPVPFGSALGSAAAALGTGQEAGMKTALENALAAQKVRDLRNMAEFRKKYLGDLDPTSPLSRAIAAITAPGGTAAPAAPSAGAAPPAGPYATPGASPAAPAAGGPLMMDRSLLYPDAAGGLLGSDVGAVGEYGAGQPATGLLGPAPPIQRTGAAVGPLDKYGMPAPPGYAFGTLPNGKPGIRAIEDGTSGSSTAPAEPDPGAGGDTPWGPTFAQGGAAGAPARGGGQTYWTPEGLAALQPTEGRYDQVHYPSGYTREGVKSSASGGFGFIDPTWRQFASQAGVDTAKWPRAYMAPAEVQNAVAAITPVGHWTGVDAQGRPFNANAQRLAANPALVTGAPSTTEGSGGGQPEPDAGWGPTFAQGGPDRVIPSGAGGNPPAATLAQYAPGGGGAPGAAPAPGATGGPPLYPSAPAGNQAAAISTLITELARRNAAAEVLGLGNPYGSLLTVLQGSPQYGAAVEAAKEQAKRTIGLGFAKEQSRLEAEGKLPSEITLATNKGVIDQLNKQIEQLGTAALNPAGTLLINGPNGPVERQVNQLQKATAQAGFDVPELGFKGMRGPAPAGQIPGLGPAPGAPGPGPQAQGGTPGGPGTLYDKPFFTPAEDTVGKASGEDIFKARTVAQDAAQTIETTKEARKLLDSGIFVGAGSDKVTALAKIGNALHLTGTNTKETVSNTEAYFATVAGNVGRMIKQFGSGTGLSDADREYAAKMAAGQQSLDEASMRKILDITDRAGFNVINRHNTSVAGIRPGVSLTPLTVTPPTPYQRGIDKATYDSLPSGSPFTAPDGSQRIKP